MPWAISDNAAYYAAIHCSRQLLSQLFSSTSSKSTFRLLLISFMSKVWWFRPLKLRVKYILLIWHQVCVYHSKIHTDYLFSNILLSFWCVACWVIWACLCRAMQGTDLRTGRFRTWTSAISNGGLAADRNFKIRAYLSWNQSQVSRDKTTSLSRNRWLI